MAIERFLSRNAHGAERGIATLLLSVCPSDCNVEVTWVSLLRLAYSIRSSELQHRQSKSKRKISVVVFGRKPTLFLDEARQE